MTDENLYFWLKINIDNYEQANCFFNSVHVFFMYMAINHSNPLVADPTRAKAGNRVISGTDRIENEKI
jgi:hypothetical protein